DLHELIRVFALAHLRERAEADERAARLRHAAHYIAAAETAQQQFLAGGDGITAGLALFDREPTQLDAARTWLQQRARDPAIDNLLIDDAEATAYIGELRYPKHAAELAGQPIGRILQLETALAASRRRDRRDAQARFLGNLGSAYFAL